MNIRLMGSPDIIQAWAANIEQVFGVQCALYKCRGSNDVRAYCTLDDRIAAQVWVEIQGPPPPMPPPIPAGLPAPKRKWRAKGAM